MAKATLFLELDKEQLSVLRRALEARARDMQMRLGSDPGDEGFRREVRLATQLLRQVEALERQAGYRAWDIRRSESLPEDDED
jgi:hypothetical protein